MLKNNPNNPVMSKDNDVIKHLRSLSDPKHRKKEQVFMIEGVKMVEEALRDNAGVNMLVATPTLVQHHGKGLLKLAATRSITVFWISEKLMDAVSESKTPQPVIAVVRMKEHGEEELLVHTAGLIIIAHQLQDPGNLGTIIRTAEAVGAAGVALSPHTADPFSAKAVRASMGSILRVPLVRIGETGAFVTRCKQRGFQTLAAVVAVGTAHFNVDLTKPTVVILGQEGTGLPQDIIADVDLRVRIPMADSIDSLNVATSAAVILYEMMRQRLQR